MAQRYNNRVELKDGEVILFNRAGAKRPIWHMRVTCTAHSLCTFCLPRT